MPLKRAEGAREVLDGPIDAADRRRHAGRRRPAQRVVRRLCADAARRSAAWRRDPAGARAARGRRRRRRGDVRGASGDVGAPVAAGPSASWSWTRSRRSLALARARRLGIPGSAAHPGRRGRAAVPGARRRHRHERPHAPSPRARRRRWRACARWRRPPSIGVVVNDLLRRRLSLGLVWLATRLFCAVTRSRGTTARSRCGAPTRRTSCGRWPSRAGARRLDDPRISRPRAHAGGPVVTRRTSSSSAPDRRARPRPSCSPSRASPSASSTARAFRAPKICGEYLSPEAPRLLDRLGALKAVDAVASPLKGMRITAPDGTTLVGTYHAVGAWRPYREQAMALPREALDAILVDRVRSLPGRLQRGGARHRRLRLGRPGARASRRSTSERRRLTLRAPLTIAADGRASVVAQRLGLRRPHRLRRMALVDVRRGRRRPAGPSARSSSIRPTTRSSTRSRRSAPTSSLVVPLDSRGAVERTPRRVLRRPRQAAAAPGPAHRRRAPGRPRPGDGPPRVPGRRRRAPAACCWSATRPASTIPFTGEGIFNGLRAAELAAETAVRALRVGDVSAAALAGYDRARRLASARQGARDARAPDSDHAPSAGQPGRAAPGPPPAPARPPARRPRRLRAAPRAPARHSRALTIPTTRCPDGGDTR